MQRAVNESGRDLLKPLLPPILRKLGTLVALQRVLFSTRLALLFNPLFTRP